MVAESRVVLYVDNLSSKTRSSDIKRTFSIAGTVLDVERDVYDRCALVEFKRESDAKYAWRKLDRKFVDGREIRVDWATKKDFARFGWKWTEDDYSPSRSRSRSRSRSPTRSPATD